MIRGMKCISAVIPEWRGIPEVQWDCLRHLSTMSGPGRALLLHLVGQRTKLDHLNRTLWPIMLPADDHIAPGRVMAVVAEIAARELELDAHRLPAIELAVDAAFGLAVRVSRPDALYGDS